MSIATDKTPRSASPPGDTQRTASSGSAAPVGPAKLRRRPVLGALSVGLICLGALLGVWVYTSGTEAREVLAVRGTVERGQVITDSDLIAVRVSLDPALAPVPASERGNVVGERAAWDLSAGSLITRTALTSDVVPARGQAVVGISLGPGMVPAGDLVAGDEVRLVLTPGESGQPGTTEPSSKPATVLAVHDAPDGAGILVDVVAPEADAPTIAAWAATGRVGLVLESRER